VKGKKGRQRHSLDAPEGDLLPRDDSLAEGDALFFLGRARAGDSFCIYLYKTDRHTCTHKTHIHTHTHITHHTKAKGERLSEVVAGNEALGKIED